MRGGMSLSTFRKYLHVERYGNDEVEGIELGEVYVFPKIDGTNGSLWMDDEGNIHAGSRNRELTPDNDNAGFYTWVLSLANINRYDAVLSALPPGTRLFGEWLVPHTLKTYEDKAWRDFYVFDVAKPAENERGYEFVPYYDYAPTLDEHTINHIPPQKIIRNGRKDDFVNELEGNFYLLPDGSEPGEGIVLKNYAYRNKYGRQHYAKLVRNEFKLQHTRTMGAPVLSRPELIEQAIAESTVTKVLVDKTMAKIQTSEGTGWKSQYIPRLLGTVHHDVITEELWDELKRLKDPTIDFKLLKRLIIAQIRAVVPEVF
jgi:hypothetical protein